MEIGFPLDDENTKEVLYLEPWITVFNWDLEYDPSGFFEMTMVEFYLHAFINHWET